MNDSGERYSDMFNDQLIVTAVSTALLSFGKINSRGSTTKPYFLLRCGFLNDVDYSFRSMENGIIQGGKFVRRRKLGDLNKRCKENERNRIFLRNGPLKRPLQFEYCVNNRFIGRSEIILLATLHSFDKVKLLTVQWLS